MDTDRIARHFDARRSRRGVIGGTAAGLAALALGRTAAQDATPAGTADPGGGPPPATPGEDRAFMFVQTFASGSFHPNPHGGTPDARGTPTTGGGAAYLLTLAGHHGETIYFSDRPDRVFGEAPTQRFLAGLDFAPANPPNAALVAQTGTGDNVVVLELIEPAYAADAGTVTYGAELLASYQGEGLAHVAEQQLDTALPETFGRASLFIDDCPALTDCWRPSGPFEVPIPMEPLPGGRVGMCWSWSDYGCTPCDGRGRGYYNDRCNNEIKRCRDEFGDPWCFAG